MNIQTLTIDRIDASDRLRGVDEDWVALLADSIERNGLRQPIEVRDVGSERYQLVAGGHRLRAVMLLGRETIAATIFEGSELEARLREIDENLIRHELTELDRSTFLAERKRVYEALYPATRHGGTRAAGQVANDGEMRFTVEAAERLGLSERTIQRAVTRHERLHPDVRRRLLGTWLADHGAQLDALARATPTEQVRVVDLMFEADGKRPSSVVEALAAVRGVAVPPPPDADEAAFQAFLRAWRQSGAFRKRVRAHVARDKV